MVGEHEWQREGGSLGHQPGEVVESRKRDVDDARARTVDHLRVVAQLAVGKNLHLQLAIAGALHLLLELLRQGLLQIALRRRMRETQRRRGHGGT